MEPIKLSPRSIKTTIQVGPLLESLLAVETEINQQHQYYGGLLMRREFARMDLSMGLVPVNPLTTEEQAALEGYEARLVAYYEEEEDDETY